MEPTRDLCLTDTMAIKFPHRAGFSRRGSRSPQALPQQCSLICARLQDWLHAEQEILKPER
jgi:hypothetical protein